MYDIQTWDSQQDNELEKYDEFVRWKNHAFDWKNRESKELMSSGLAINLYRLLLEKAGVPSARNSEKGRR